MAKTLYGVDNLDKSLTGIITITDGNGTTISDGTVECNNLIVHNDVTLEGTTTFENLTVTNTITTNNITFTGDMNDEFTFNDMFNNFLKFQEVYTSLGGYGDAGLPTYDDSGNTITFPENVNITGTITTNNITFTGNMNEEFTFNDMFNNFLKLQEVYTSLGGYGDAGLPTYNDAGNEITFPGNVYITGQINGVEQAQFVGLLGQITEMYNSFAYDSYYGGPSWDDPSSTITFPTKLKINLDLTILGKEFLLSPSITSSDANFNNKNYLQLCISKNDTSNVTNAVCGIDFTPLTTRTTSSTRIYARQNNNLSADLCFATAPSGSLTSTTSQRMVILANGNVGINSNFPGYTLDVVGTCRASKFLSNDYGANSATNDTLFCAEKTSGNVKICYISTFTGNVFIGDSVNKANTNYLYGNTHVNGPAISLNGTTSGNLYGSNWRTEKPPIYDNSTRIATTDWVYENAVTLEGGLSRPNQETYTYLVPASTGTTGLNFSKICMSANGEMGFMFNGTNIYKTSSAGEAWTLQHTATTNISSICCSYTGQYVYYSMSGTNKAQYSSNYGQTFSAITTVSPTAGSSHKVFCSYDGSILCFVITNPLSSMWVPFYNIEYGTSATWVPCYPVTSSSSSINSLIINGESGIVNSITIAAGKSSYNDYVYFSTTPATSWTQKLTSSIWSSLSYQQNGTIWLGNNNGLGIYKSVDNGVNYTQLSSTIGKYVSDVDSSWDDSQVVWCSNTLANVGYYYSRDAGVTFYQRSTLYLSYVTTSQSCKTTLLVPNVTTDVIYIHETNQNIVARCDLFLPKQRMTLLSNQAFDYGDSSEVYYPYRTMFLGLSTSNTATLRYPLYESYIIYPTNNCVLTLPDLNENTVGLKITICKITAQPLNFICSGSDLLYDYGVHTPVNTLSGTGLGTNTTSTTLMSAFGVTSQHAFCWIIITPH